MERTGTLMMLITLEGVREGVHGTAAVLEPITRKRTHSAEDGAASYGSDTTLRVGL
jgi:hypothetical protein